MFGKRLAEAMFATREYGQELKEGRSYTECTWMDVPGAARSTANIFVLVSASDGNLIRDALYTQ